MQKLDRREFLISSAVLAGTGVVACSSSPKVDESLKKDAPADKAQTSSSDLLPWQVCNRRKNVLASLR